MPEPIPTFVPPEEYTEEDEERENNRKNDLESYRKSILTEFEDVKNEILSWVRTTYNSDVVAVYLTGTF